MTNTSFASGATGKKFHVRAMVASTGLPKEDIVYNTATLVAKYQRTGAAAVTATLVTGGTVGSALNHATNMDIVHVHGGLYEVSAPNNALLTGADRVMFTFAGISDCVITVAQIDILGADPRSSDPVQADIRKINDVSVVGNGVSPKFGV